MKERVVPPEYVDFVVFRNPRNEIGFRPYRLADPSELSSVPREDCEIINGRKYIPTGKYGPEPKIPNNGTNS